MRLANVWALGDPDTIKIREKKKSLQVCVFVVSLEFSFTPPKTKSYMKKASPLCPSHHAAKNTS